MRPTGKNLFPSPPDSWEANPRRGVNLRISRGRTAFLWQRLWMCWPDANRRAGDRQAHPM